MDIPSNSFIAWFYRSTYPFHTFLVSINDQFGWFCSNLLLCYPWIEQTIFIPSKNWDRASCIQIFAMPTHTYHRFGFSVELCDDECSNRLGSLLVISPHMHSILIPQIQNNPYKYRFLSGIWLSCIEGNENPQ